MADERGPVEHSAYWGDNWSTGETGSDGKPVLHAVGRFNRAQSLVLGLILIPIGLVLTGVGIGIDLKQGVYGPMLMGIVMLGLGIVSLVIRATRWKGYSKD